MLTHRHLSAGLGDPMSNFLGMGHGTKSKDGVIKPLTYGWQSINWTLRHVTVLSTRFNLAKMKMTRKRLFRAALAMADLTAGEWAEKVGISESYLSLILNEKRPSEAVDAKIDAFIEQHVAVQTVAVAR